MSGKKNKRPFNDTNEEESIGFRNPEHRQASEETESDGVATTPEVSEDESTDTEESETENFDDEERGWHTFDMDNPDESL